MNSVASNDGAKATRALLACGGVAGRLYISVGLIAFLGTKALSRWILGLGIVAATLSILSLASLALFPASVFFPLGRSLSFVWSIAIGLVLALGKRRETTAEL